MPLEVHVVSPERELWAGEAEMVVAKGTEGDVGVLAGHAPMLISLQIAPLRILRDQGGEQMVLVDGGFLHVATEEGTTRVDVLADGGHLPEEVDRSQAEARVAELRRRVEDEEEVEAEAELQKALMRAEHGGR